MKSKHELRIVVGDHECPLRLVNIWMGDERRTGEDCFVFPRAFMYAMQKSVDHLRTELKFLRHEEELRELGIEQDFNFVSPRHLHGPLRICARGPYYG